MDFNVTDPILVIFFIKQLIMNGKTIRYLCTLRNRVIQLEAGFRIINSLTFM